MENSELFLGFPLSSEFLDKLNKVSPEIRSFIIQNDPDYLRQVTEKGIVYLGKSLGHEVDFETLSLCQNNIFSLLKRLVPDFHYDPDDLLLFPCYL